MSTPKDHAERLRRNSESRNRAEHFREPWSEEEIEMLMELWRDRDVPEEEVAEALGRTIEACRQRFYEVRRGERSYSIKVTTTRTTTTKTFEVTSNQPLDVCPECWQMRSATGNCAC